MAYIGTKPGNQVVDGSLIADGTITPADLSTGKPVWDTSGNVGIGTSSPSFPLDIATTNANIRVAPSTPTNNALTRYVNAGGTGFVGLDNAAGGLNVPYALHLFHTGAYPIVMSTNNTERMRIDSSGNLLIGTTTAKEKLTVNGWCTLNNQSLVSGYASTLNTSCNGGSFYGIMIQNLSTAQSNAMTFINSSATPNGSITVTTTATSYNTSSDYRLKENIAPMTGALAKVTQLKPCTYTWKADGSAGEGFIAHELAEVVPQAVSGEKDAVNEDGSIKPQGIDTSFLVATLTAAIQELKAEVDSLKAQLSNKE